MYVCVCVCPPKAGEQEGDRETVGEGAFHISFGVQDFSVFFSNALALAHRNKHTHTPPKLTIASQDLKILVIYTLSSAIFPEMLLYVCLFFACCIVS